MPDEWQARQATPAILQVSISKHNAKKITTRERGPFQKSITAILTEEIREEKDPEFTKPTQVAVYLFRVRSIETGVDSKDDSGSQGQYREERRSERSKRENDADRRILRNDRQDRRTFQNNRHNKRELRHTRTYTGRV